jgi:hypothetical protein
VPVGCPGSAWRLRVGQAESRRLVAYRAAPATWARENGSVYHSYTVWAPDPFVAPYFSFLLEGTPKAEPAEPRSWRKDECPE